MAKIVDTTPSWMKKENASVFDSFPKKAVRKVAELMGLDTGEGQIESAVMPAPLVSIFKNKAARMLGGAEFKKKVSQMAHPGIKDAFRHFELDYPRIAAHMDPNLIDVEKGLMGSTLAPRGKVKELVPVGINRRASAMKYPSEAKNTVYHEGTHVAQSLGNKDFDRLYNNANNLVGYEDNPFEVQARKAGTRSVAGNSGEPAGNAITDLEEIAQLKKHDAQALKQSNRNLHVTTPAADSILGTLKRRGRSAPEALDYVGPTPEELHSFLDKTKDMGSTYKFKKKTK